MFAGHRGDIDQVIHAADALLVPSSNEAWSRVVPEAFAAGCPVVVSNVGGLPEIVKPDETGWLSRATWPDSPGTSPVSGAIPHGRVG